MGVGLMGALSYDELKKYLEEEDLRRRLVVSPLLEPTEQLRQGQASIDVRLGCEFRVPVPFHHPYIDTMEDGKERSGAYHRKVYVPLAGDMVVHPHQFLLGTTIEYLRFPENLMAYVVGRSSWGRYGLTVATAVGIHPCFAGVLTLELRNLGEVPLKLHPGDAIAQLFVHKLEGVPSFSSYPARQSQFGGSTSPSLGVLRSGRTKDKLRRLRKRFSEQAHREGG